jgi:hypothetical protein
MDKLTGLSGPNNTMHISTSSSEWGVPAEVVPSSAPELIAKVSSSISPAPHEHHVVLITSADVKSVKFALSATANSGKSVVEQLNAQLSGTASWPILHPTD